jgi:hypothetical protein
MSYARINLSKTNYTKLDSADWEIIIQPDVNELDNIYKSYCRYKKFKSVMPIFPSEYTNPSNELLGYKHNDKLVAFSLIRIFDNENAECAQFAWTYHNPRIRLGFKSLEHECALYKERGFKYLYLGGADEYKKKILGFETLGPILF